MSGEGGGPRTQISQARTSPLAITATFISVGLLALVLGGLTSVAQKYLPDLVVSFANSSSGWVILVCLMLWFSRLQALLAAFAGLLAFVLMVEGYRIASEWRGLSYGDPFQDKFTFIGILVGPIIGVSIGILRFSHYRWRALAVTPVTSILLGEGVYGLTVISESSSPFYWCGMIALAFVLLVGVMRNSHASIKLWCIATLLTVVAAVLFWICYSQLGQLLIRSV